MTREEFLKHDIDAINIEMLLAVRRYIDGWDHCVPLTAGMVLDYQMRKLYELTGMEYKRGFHGKIGYSWENEVVRSFDEYVALLKERRW